MKMILMNIIWFVWFGSANCQKDYFFVIQKYFSSEVSDYLCTTNSSLALSWIGKSAESIPAVSKFIPPLPGKNPFQNPPKNWLVEKSLNGFVNEVILDRRWENLKEYKTNLVDGQLKSLHYVSVLQDLKNNLTIPLSILTDEAHIFLCNGSDVSRSSCYWLLMQAFEGNKTAFRKCDPNYVPTKDRQFPTEPCKNLLAEITHPKDFPNYMSKDGWSHFKLEKSSNQITLSQVSEDASRVIITYFDNDTVIDVTHMIIHSKVSNGLWKIHEVKYMYTTKETRRIRFGEIITVIENSVCISMFTSMCSSCGIKLTISTENDPSRTLHQEMFKTQAGWSEIKFLVENISEQKVILLISTINRNSNYKNFWAIGEMRQCHKKEIRYISTNKSENCQLVSSTENVISTESAIMNNEKNNCPEDTVSRFCIPCSWFPQECGRMKIYEKYATTTKYSCSAGYTTGIECESPCFDGDYGYSCRKKCGKCEDVCNKIDGKCKSCTDNYSGEKCEIAPKIVRNIKITSLSPSRVQIEWDKPLFYFSDNTTDLLFTIKYQHKAYISCAPETSDMNWESSKTTAKNYVTLDKLEPYSNYSFSIFVSHKNEKGPKEIREFQTDSSETIAEQEIPAVEDITTNSIYATVKFSNVECKKIRGPVLLIKMKAACKNQWCNGSSNQQDYYHDDLSVTLKMLTPFSNYSLEIEYCRNEDICSDVKTQIFNTKSTVPKTVTNLDVYTKNENSISLRWTPPYPPKGILEFYILRYHDNSSKHSKNFSITHCRLWRDFHCATLTNLLNSTSYTIQVTAKNKEVPDVGQVRGIQVVTKTEPSEAPYEVDIHWTLENNLELRWKHPNRANGDIKFFKITIIPYKNEKVGNGIERQLFVNEYNLTYHYKINATYFLPSTQYKILISAFNGHEGKQSVITDVSPPSIPSLDSAPKIVTLTNTTITIEILINKFRNESTSNEYKLFIILGSDNSGNTESRPELVQFMKDFQISLQKFKILYECDIRVFNISRLTIGRNEDIEGCNRTTNFSLNTKNSFNITIILTNNDKSNRRFKLYYIFNNGTSDITTTSKSKDLHLLALLLLLLMIPIIIAIVYYIKRKPTEQRNSFENTTLLDGYSNPVQITGFQTYVKMWINHEKLKQEYYKIASAKFEHTYNDVKGQISVDYVDMCFSQCQIDKAYMVVTIPQQNNTTFWKNVWTENVKYIVVIDNHHENKPDSYWPEESTLLESGNLLVHLQCKDVFSDYEYGKFRLIMQDKIKHVEQIRFTSWINEKEPLHFLKMVPLIRRTSEILLNSQSPILIHSSREKEGVGLMLLSDMCLRMAKEDGVVDVLKILQKLTHTFNITLDSVWQYQVAHLIVAEILMQKDTSLNVNSFGKNSEFFLIERKLKKHLLHLNNTKWLDISMSLIIEDITKYGYCRSEMNSERDSVPLLLRKKQLIDPNNNKTLVVDGFRNPAKFMITKQPSSENFEKFWRCISENNISAIISLNEPINQQNKFWPNRDNKILTVSKSISIKYKESIKLKSFKLITADLLSYGDRQKKKEIKIILLKNWISQYTCPPFVYDFVNFCIESNKISEASHPVLITCSDGITASGLYVTILYNMEKIKFENICDICTCVRIMRRYCQEFIRDEEQFKFIYHATLEYFKNFRVYYNWK